MPKESVTLTDNRTGKTYELPIVEGTIRATDLRQIKVSEDDFGLMTYDPAFMNTASCRSAITYIDGDAGVLQHRGYPIEQLCERSSYLEVAYLVIYGSLPTKAELQEWIDEITIHTFVHENVKDFMQGFRYDAHPMGILIGTVVSYGVKGQDKKASASDATPLTVPSPQMLSSQFSQISKQLEPSVVNINTESTIKAPKRRRGDFVQANFPTRIRIALPNLRFCRRDSRIVFRFLSALGDRCKCANSRRAG